MGWFNVQMEEQLRTAARKEAIQSLNSASQAPSPKVGTLYTDVLDDKPWTLREQEAEMYDMMERYPEHYKAFRK